MSRLRQRTYTIAGLAFLAQGATMLAILLMDRGSAIFLALFGVVDILLGAAFLWRGRCTYIGDVEDYEATGRR